MVMKMPNCPDHGDLMRELALGRLEDERSFAAESILQDCTHCAGWWAGAFGGDAFDAVEAAVADEIASFTPPARRRREWLAVAATVVFAIGIGGVSVLWRGNQAVPSHADGIVSTMNFEAGALTETVSEADETAAENGEASAEAAVFSSDLESGDLSTWSSHS
jgi:hypothetical protein